MRAQASRFSSAAPLAAAMLFCALPGAEAGDAAYCVTCKGPEQTYLCRVAGDVRSDAAKLYCVVRTAKEGGHASCAAREAMADTRSSLPSPFKSATASESGLLAVTLPSR